MKRGLYHGCGPERRFRSQIGTFLTPDEEAAGIYALRFRSEGYVNAVELDDTGLVIEKTDHDRPGPDGKFPPGIDVAIRDVVIRGYPHESYRLLTQAAVMATHITGRYQAGVDHRWCIVNQGSGKCLRVCQDAQEAFLTVQPGEEVIPTEECPEHARQNV